MSVKFYIMVCCVSTADIDVSNVTRCLLCMRMSVYNAYYVAISKFYVHCKSEHK